MLAQIDRNFGLHATLIPSKTEGMKVFRSAHLSYVDSGLSCDTFNIIHIDRPELNKQELEKALNHFREKKRDYCLWIHKENLSPALEGSFADLGLKMVNKEIGMVLALENYQLLQEKRHANIQIVNSEALLKTYAEVLARNWTPPDTNVQKYFEKTADLYLTESKTVTLLLYYHENEAVSTAELFVSEAGVIGAYGFSTLEDYRGKGIGSALFSYALNFCKEKGFEKVILQATEDGLGIYLRYGFEPITTYYEYA